MLESCPIVCFSRPQIIEPPFRFKTGGKALDTLLQGTQSLKLAVKEDHIPMFEAYYRELIRWNKKTNLTSIVDYEEV